MCVHCFTSDGSPQVLISKNIKILISYIILMPYLNINILLYQDQADANKGSKDKTPFK